MDSIVATQAIRVEKAKEMWKLPRTDGRGHEGKKDA